MAVRIVLLLACSLLAVSSASAQTGPFLQVSPSPVVSGGETTAFGTGFCAAAACSTVTVSVDDRVVGAGIQVNPEGGFQVTFVVTEPPGQYRVTATQRAADGSTLEATYGLLVPAADFPPDYTPRPPTQAPATPEVDEGTPQPTAAGSPTPALTPVSSPTGTPPTPAPPPSPGDGGNGPPWYVWLLIAAGGLGAFGLAGAAALRWRRARTSTGA